MNKKLISGVSVAVAATTGLYTAPHIENMCAWESLSQCVERPQNPHLPDNPHPQHNDDSAALDGMLTSGTATSGGVEGALAGNVTLKLEASGTLTA
jgi:hypothetical protein